MSFAKARLKVLLVEDDNYTRATIKAMLREIGIKQIFEAIDGIQAQDFIDSAEHELDLIICDWNMPKKNGHEFLQNVRSLHYTLPFLMITARADESSVANAQKAGVSAYLRKPFPLSQLEQKMDFVLRFEIEMR